MISFDEAISVVVGAAQPIGMEHVSITDAHRRVLAQPVIARVDSPPSDVSAMDGYAVRDCDLSDFPARLEVIGTSFAGTGFQGSMAPGCAVRIFTGAPVPDGADRVVIQEIVKREADLAVIEAQPGASRHIRTKGSDFQQGNQLLDMGTSLGYRHLVAAAGADLDKLAVYRRPAVTIMSTGDELVPPGTALEHPGTIPESVSFGVAALVADWGGTTRERVSLPDDLSAMKRTVAEVLGRADLIVVTGGASVGEKDFAKTMFDGQGLQLLFSKVAIKPGKPVWLGTVGSALVLGLPGNPTSALVTARLFLAPLVAGLAGLDPATALRWRAGSLSAPLPASGDRETFVRADVDEAGIVPLSNQDSSAQRMLVDAALLIRRRPGEQAAGAGDNVEVIDF